MYKLFICLRYLRSRTISYIAIGALGLGVMILIIVTSVMGGFQREFHKKIRGTIADVSVESKIFFGLQEKDGLQREIEKNPHVVATAPIIENIVLVDTPITKDYGFLKGIDPQQESQVGEFAKTLCSDREILESRLEGTDQIMRKVMRDAVEASSDKKPDAAKIFETKSGLPGLVVGVQLYTYMRMDVGDEVTLVTTSNLDRHQAHEKDVREMKFEVVGAFKTGMFEQDKRFLYAPIAPAQKFIGAEGRLSGINIKLRDYRDAEQVSREIAFSLKNPDLYVLPWNKRNENLIRAVATERWMIGCIVFFMIILAGLNLTAILTMVVIEKTKDLGILGAIGATRMGLMSIFLFQGGVIAILGAALGTAMGFLFVDNINWIDKTVVASILGHPAFDPQVYYLDTIPVEVDPWGIAFCCGATMVLGFLLAVYPAIRAARLEPMEALRYE